MAKTKARVYVVTAPYVMLKCKDLQGGLQVLEFYQGGVLPESADPVNLKALVDKGMVAESGSDDAELIYGGGPTLAEMRQLKADEVAAAEAEKALKSPAKSKTAVEDADDDDADTKDADADADAEAEKANGRPRANASLEAWQEYAVAKQVADGASEEDAKAAVEGKTRNQLVTEFGDIPPFGG